MLGRDCLNLYFTIDYIIVTIRLQTIVLSRNDCANVRIYVGRARFVRRFSFFINRRQRNPFWECVYVVYYSSSILVVYSHEALPLSNLFNICISLVRTTELSHSAIRRAILHLSVCLSVCQCQSLYARLPVTRY